ncbi:H-type lectin domain-containing protein [Chitinimonas lacunae]|uniref:H-type lectin domain-containing protein n=1 Tax=Chitinimonas lacunae TaxID=1963018 RepID=A0ABV8MKQ0_9NEIS
MSTVFAERPQFFEGQYLGASDLQALLDYLSELQQRHQLSSHSWGIAAGIDLIYQTSPLGHLEAYLTPGVASDGYGRTLVVNQAFPLDPSLFTSQPTGLVKVWLRYDELAGQGVRQGFEVCGTSDAYARVSESFLVEVGERVTIDRRQSGVNVDQTFYPDAREALGDALPGQPIAPDGAVAAQLFPGPDDLSLWLVPVGLVHWQGGKLMALSATERKLSRLFRRYSGWVGESLSGSGGLLRLGRRFLPREAGKSVEAICQAVQPTELDMIYCENDKDTPVFREPIWLDSHTRARGDLRFYGSRAEWLDREGTDYLADGTVSALRRNGRSPLNGVDLEVLLGKRAGSAGPTRLVVGAASVKGSDPCAVDFTLTAGMVIQEDGYVGIGSTSTVLDKPLTLKAATAHNGLIGFENSSGALAFQLNLGPAGEGLNLTRSDPAKSDLLIANNGTVGINTLQPFVALTVQGSLGFKAGSAPEIYLFESGTLNPDRMILTHSPAFQDWGLQYRDSNDSFVFLGDGQPRCYIGLQDGRVGIGTVSPVAPLEVRGDIRLGSSGNYFAVGAGNSLTMVAGRVASNGTLQSGSGFSSSLTSTGQYNITFSSSFAGTPVVVVSSTSDDASGVDNQVSTSSISTSGFRVSARDVGGGGVPTPQNTSFTFIAIGPRP